MKNTEGWDTRVLLVNWRWDNGKFNAFIFETREYKRKQK